MTMTQRPHTSGMGSGVSLPPLMEVLGDLWRAPHSDQSRYNMPRRFAELDNAQDRESNQATVDYTGYAPVYPPGDIDRRRLSIISSTTQAEIPFLPSVSSMTSPRGSSSESERHGIHSLPSLLSHTLPPTPSTSGSRYPYDTDYPPHLSNSTAYYRHSGEYSSYLPPSPPSNTQFSSHSPTHPAPLLTQAYPNPREGMYIPRLSQPVSMPDQSPFSPSTPGGLETFDQVARLGNKRRRGNLPKHVTDTLRNWLTNHVAHPYPTEDEKQQLCQITGLNMNQISNWFINARRRKLPQQRSDAEQHLLPQPRATTPPKPSTSLGHTRSHSRDTTSIFPPPLPPPGTYSSSGR